LPVTLPATALTSTLAPTAEAVRVPSFRGVSMVNSLASTVTADVLWNLTGPSTSTEDVVLVLTKWLNCTAALKTASASKTAAPYTCSPSSATLTLSTPPMWNLLEPDASASMDGPRWPVEVSHGSMRFSDAEPQTKPMPGFTSTSPYAESVPPTSSEAAMVEAALAATDPVVRLARAKTPKDALEARSVCPTSKAPSMVEALVARMNSVVKLAREKSKKEALEALITEPTSTEPVTLADAADSAPPSDSAPATAPDAADKSPPTVNAVVTVPKVINNAPPTVASLVVVNVGKLMSEKEPLEAVSNDPTARKVLIVAEAAESPP